MNSLYFKKLNFSSLLLKSAMLFAISFITYKGSAQSSVSYSIGEMLAAGSGGLVLADGTIAHAEVIILGTGSPLEKNGQYNINDLGGGILNGINNNAITTGTIDDSALTIAQYAGSKRVGDFTAISAFPASVDKGRTSSYANAIGFRIWFSKPINVQQFLMIDCDGNGDNSDPNNPATNGEWFSCFGYSGTTQVLPSAITLAPGTDLASSSRTVNNDWSTLVTSKISGAATFSTMTFPRITANHNSVDPDDIQNQGLFNFTTPVDNVFFLWGIFGDVNSTPGSAQNSAVSPLVFSLYTDFGDAPDTYHTSKVNNGASHEIYNYMPGAQNSTLTLGTTVNFEATGNATTAANSDSDDGVASVVAFDCGTSTYSTTVSLLNNTGSSANLYAWVDFNQNGEFESNEIQTVTIASSTTQQSIVLNWSGIAAPTDCGTIGTSYMRLRLTFDNLADDISSAIDERSFGGASGGEVEDYKVTILPKEGSLPIQLVSFASVVANNKVLLSWTAENEIDGKYYEIERSNNGIDFTPIDKIISKNYNGNFNTYQAADLLPSNGLNFYRIKIIEKNGVVTYSKIITQRIVSNNGIHISINPNPFVDRVNINVDLQQASSIQINLVDAVGRIILAKSVKGNTGVNWINLDKLDKLPKGLYSISIKTNNGLTQKKLIKSK